MLSKSKAMKPLFFNDKMKRSGLINRRLFACHLLKNTVYKHQSCVRYKL